MTYEAKALPDWKPEDGCVPDEWLIAFRDGRLTDEQQDLLSGHRWCVECIASVSASSCRDVSGEWLSRAASSDPESLMTWKPEDGCIPIELLFAIDMELFSEETELRLCAPRRVSGVRSPAEPSSTCQADGADPDAAIAEGASVLERRWPAEGSRRRIAAAGVGAGTVVVDADALPTAQGTGPAAVDGEVGNDPSSTTSGRG